jgi:hypothetical protein
MTSPRQWGGAHWWSNDLPTSVGRRALEQDVFLSARVGALGLAQHPASIRPLVWTPPPVPSHCSHRAGSWPEGIPGVASHTGPIPRSLCRTRSTRRAKFTPVLGRTAGLIAWHNDLPTSVGRRALEQDVFRSARVGALGLAQHPASIRPLVWTPLRLPTHCAPCASSWPEKLPASLRSPAQFPPSLCWTRSTRRAVFLLSDRRTGGSFC